jgi:hypothetical protein
VARGEDQHRNPKSNIEIAQEAEMRPIGEIAAEKLGIPDSAVEPYGKFKAKIALDYIRSLPERPNRKLILVTAITPTPAGEGKTTTTVGLGDALNLMAKKRCCASAKPAWARALASKAGLRGAGMRKSCRWRTSTCTSPVICMRLAPPTICSRRWSTITSITVSSHGWIRAGSLGGARST